MSEGAAPPVGGPGSGAEGGGGGNGGERLLAVGGEEGQGGEGQGGSTISVSEEQQVLEIPKTFSSFRVLPKDDEKGDKNFPPHLHAAAQLFMMTGMIQNAMRLQKCVSGQLKLLEKGPDGFPSSMGCACVCWSCGHVGLPSNAEQVGEELKIPGKCRACGGEDQTNFARLYQPDGSYVPWIEKKEGGMGAGAGGGAGGGAKKIPPNAPCPCGSEKKHKKCCGKAG